jgi:hypothetical protein
MKFDASAAKNARRFAPANFEPRSAPEAAYRPKNLDGDLPHRGQPPIGRNEGLGPDRHYRRDVNRVRRLKPVPRAEPRGSRRHMAIHVDQRRTLCILE